MCKLYFRLTPRPRARNTPGSCAASGPGRASCTEISSSEIKMKPMHKFLRCDLLSRSWRKLRLRAFVESAVLMEHQREAGNFGPLGRESGFRGFQGIRQEFPMGHTSLIPSFPVERRSGSLLAAGEKQPLFCSGDHHEEHRSVHIF